MGAAGPRWAVVDELVHELGSLRAVVQEIEAHPAFSEDRVVLDLRTSLARAADTLHLVIGGDEGMVSQARRCIAEAREVAGRARRAVGPPAAVYQDAPRRTRVAVQPGRRHTAGAGSGDPNAARHLPKKEPRAKT